MTTVFVSGATGFLALHVIKQLLAKDYKVIGSVRSTQKGDLVKKAIANENFLYYVVPSLTENEPFAAVLKEHPEITVFLHTASPVDFSFTEDFDGNVLQPAIKGTVNALKDVKKYAPQVTNFVFTSSVVAMFPLGYSPENGEILSETSWNPITYEKAISNVSQAYYGSKTFAEKQAWEFVEKEKPNFAFSVVCPGYILGPQAYYEYSKENINFSASIVTNALKLGKNDSFDNLSGLYISPTDVAKAHIEAFEKDLKNARLLLVHEPFTVQTILDIVRERVPEVGEKLPLGIPGEGQKKLDNFFEYDNSKTRKLLSFDFVGLEQSVVDIVKQLQE